jgi:ketopantoate reductase
MRIGILGSGLMGGKLGTILARAGHDVVFSYSRSEKKLERLAREAGGRARAGTPAKRSPTPTRCCSPCTGAALTMSWRRLDRWRDKPYSRARCR